MDKIIKQEIELAEAVATGLCETASQCPAGQDALRARLVQAGQTIDLLVARVKHLMLAAKMNHNTVVEMQQS
jgi:hypothetical protein